MTHGTHGRKAPVRNPDDRVLDSPGPDPGQRRAPITGAEVGRFVGMLVVVCIGLLVFAGTLRLTLFLLAGC